MAKMGYTKFDNDYFLHLSKFDLNGSEFRVLLFLIRQTACFKRIFTNDCSYSFIANGTGLSESSCKRAINSLIKKEYIEICNQASGAKSYSYRIKVVKLGNLGGQVWSHKVVKVDHNKVSVLTTKENKEDNNKKKKEKREAALHSFPNKSFNDYSFEEAKAWKEVLSENDWNDFFNGKVWD